MTHKTFRWTFVAAAAAAAPFLAPTASYALDCETDADCPDGEVCLATPCAVPDCDPSDPACAPVDCPSICSAAPVTGFADCETDADCGEGFICIVESGESCATPACPPGEECDTSIDCEPYEYSYCAFDIQPCTSDADCGDGLICYSYSYESCTGEDVACSPDGECPEPEPAECETVEEAFCVPPYVAPCAVDADCGEGFTCVEAEMCSCGGSSGGGSGGSDTPPVPEDDGGSDPSEPDAGSGDREVPGDFEDDCTCEPSGEFYCEPQQIECTSNADCPESWECVDWGDATTPCYYDEETGETVCEEPTDSADYCMPPGYGYWGGDSAGGGGGDYAEALEDAVTGQPRGEGGDGAPTVPDNNTDEGASGADDSSNEKAGCAAGPAGAALPFGAAFVGLLGLIRRRRKA